MTQSSAYPRQRPSPGTLATISSASPVGQATSPPERPELVLPLGRATEEADRAQGFSIRSRRGCSARYRSAPRRPITHDASVARPSLLCLGALDRCPALLARRGAIRVYPILGTAFPALDLLVGHDEPPFLRF